MGRQRFMGTVPIRADESALKMGGGAGGLTVGVLDTTELGTWHW